MEMYLCMYGSGWYIKRARTNSVIPSCWIATWNLTSQLDDFQGMQLYTNNALKFLFQNYCRTKKDLQFSLEWLHRKVLTQNWKQSPNNDFGTIKKKKLSLYSYLSHWAYVPKPPPFIDKQGEFWSMNDRI